MKYVTAERYNIYKYGSPHHMVHYHYDHTEQSLRSKGKHLHHSSLMLLAWLVDNTYQSMSSYQLWELQSWVSGQTHSTKSWNEIFFSPDTAGIVRGPGRRSTINDIRKFLCSFCPIQRWIDTHLNQFTVMISSPCLPINLTTRVFLLASYIKMKSANKPLHHQTEVKSSCSETQQLEYKYRTQHHTNTARGKICRYLNTSFSVIPCNWHGIWQRSKVKTSIYSLNYEVTWQNEKKKSITNLLSIWD